MCNDDSGAPLTAIAHGSSRSAARQHARGWASLRASQIAIHGWTACRLVARSAWRDGAGARFRPAEPSSAAGYAAAPRAPLRRRARQISVWLAAKSWRGVTASGYRCPSVSRCCVTKSLSGCARRPARARHHAVSAAAPADQREPVRKGGDARGREPRGRRAANQPSSDSSSIDRSDRCTRQCMPY